MFPERMYATFLIILFLPIQVGVDRQPSPKGRLVPFPAHEGYDREGKPIPLREMRSENILLTLPQAIRIQVNWSNTIWIKYHK